MKKLLIVGAGIYQMPLIEYATSVCSVICAAPSIPEKIKKYLSKTYICDVRDKDSVLNFAREEKIDGVITDQTDIAVRTVAYVADKLGLSGIGYDVACQFTDKTLMRQRLVELGIKTIPFKSIRNFDEARDFFYVNSEHPVIIKPADNQGSRGVEVCRNLTELKNGVNKAIAYSKSSTAVIEKYACGREFVVEALCFKGEYKPLIWGDSHYFTINNMFAPYERIFPSDASDTTINKLLELNEKIIKGFRLRQGISHSEYIMDGDDIYLIETAARGGGCFISSDLINIGSGLNTEEFLVNLALGAQKKMPVLKDETKACSYMAFVLPSGTIESVEGVDVVKKLPYVHRNLLDTIIVGSKTTVTCDKTSRYVITIEADNLNQLKERMNYIRNTLKIRVNDNGNEQGIIFN